MSVVCQLEAINRLVMTNGRVTGQSQFLFEERGSLINKRWLNPVVIRNWEAVFIIC